MMTSKENLNCKYAYLINYSFLFSMRQALETVAKGRRLIIAAKIPFSPPDGYFCEMLKNEELMGKISRKKEEADEAAKEAEKIRKQRLNKKYGKKIQVERESEKRKERSEEFKKYNLLRKKKRSESGNIDADDFDIDLEDSSATDGKRNGKSKKGAASSVGKKREYRNEKYGFGGKKRGLKKNTKESAAQDDFDVRKNKTPFKGMMRGGKAGGRGAVKKVRLGKERRQQVRSRRNNQK